MIPQRDLSLLSNRLARRGGRRIPEAVLEKDYCLSWFLVGLPATPLKDILVFKGGTAIKKCYIPDYRFSEDLDFTAKDIFLQKEARLKKLWSVRLSTQVAELPEFDEVYRAVTRGLRQGSLW